MDEAWLHRRTLRLGALLFRLRYYIQAPADIASGTYRRDDDHYVRVRHDQVRIVAGTVATLVSIDEAIERCKSALRRGEDSILTADG